MSDTVSPSSTIPDPQLRTLVGVAMGLTVLAAVQVVLGILRLADIEAVSVVHRSIAVALLVGSIFAAVTAFKLRGKIDKNLFPHAVSIPVMILAQMALGEMKVTTVHMILGVLVVGGIVALFTLSRKVSMPTEDEQLDEPVS